MSWTKKVEDCRKRWVYMDAREANLLYEVPEVPTKKSSGWGGEALSDPRLEPFSKRLIALKNAGLAGLMVAKEFVRRRIAPLQDHKCKVWYFAGEGDSLMLHPTLMEENEVRKTMKSLFAVEDVADLADATLPLYRLTNKDEILEGMPKFDRWGLRPAGLEGDHENPLIPAPGSGDGAELEESEGDSAVGAESSRAREKRARVESSDEDDAAEEDGARGHSAGSPRLGVKKGRWEAINKKRYASPFFLLPLTRLRAKI